MIGAALEIVTAAAQEWYQAKPGRSIPQKDAGELWVIMARHFTDAETAAHNATVRECANAIAPPYFLNAQGLEAGYLYKQKVLSLLKPEGEAK